MKDLTLLFSALKMTAAKNIKKAGHRGFTSTRTLTAPTEILRVPAQTRLAAEQLTTLQPTALNLAIFDWAGTALDAHCIAPTEILVTAFKRQNIKITHAEARMHMGLPKDAHVRAIFSIPSIRNQWMEAKKRLPNEEDVQKVYKGFPNIEAEILQKYSKLIPGIKETVQELRKMGLKIGSTTGYPERMLEILKPIAKEQGYEPDYSVGSDPAKNFGRPNPHMIFEIMRKLNVPSPSAVLKVDDSAVGIGEIISAGGWGIGAYGYGNGTGVESLEQWDQMTLSEKNARQECAKNRLRESGAHYLIKGPEELIAVVEDINERMAIGETPTSDLAVEKSKPIFLYPRVRAF